MSLKSLFNNAAERRKQSLPYIGEERRALLEDAARVKIEADRVREFLDRIESIKNLKKIA